MGKTDSSDINNNANNDFYWNERYLSNDTGWDLGEVSPPLKKYIDQIKNKNLRILIPGCGNSHEADYLLLHNFTNITLIDIAADPIEKLKKKYSSEKRISIIHGDFFELKGEFDLILEQTFFCAINPNLRNKYADKTYELLSSGGKLVGLLFDRDFEKNGPPFGGTKNEYQNLFEKDFIINQMEVCYNSFSKRQDTELFVSLIKK